jgi:plasmid stabilization system protein ParE
LSYRVRFTEEAKEDLDQLYGFLLERDLNTAEDAVRAIEVGLEMLERFPFACRKAADGRHGPLIREFIVSFGNSGYVVLFEITARDIVTILALRHPRESDYY